MSAQIINFRPEGDHEWTRRSACAEPGTPDMFPSDGDARAIADARSLCFDCPVRMQCLTAALGNGESYGMWGGLFGNELVTARRNDVRQARNRNETPRTPAELSADILDAEAVAEDQRRADAADAAKAAELKRASDAAAYAAMLDEAYIHMKTVVTA